MKPEYFGLAPGSYVPQTILTTFEGARAGGVEPEFNSLSYHGQVRRVNQSGQVDDGEGEWKVKIFSKERISDEWLAKVFDNVSWVYRKEVGFRVPPAHVLR
jgi:prenylcysteine oxidase/farnesylcysteine lyase